MLSNTNSTSPNADNHYDEIVIGAGLSGLTMVAFLAQSGARLLVCEQTAQVNGLFNSFWRERYQFDGEIKAVENSSIMIPMLTQPGLLERIEFQRSPIALITGGQIRASHTRSWRQHFRPSPDYLVPVAARRHLLQTC